MVEIQAHTTPFVLYKYFPQVSPLAGSGTAVAFGSVAAWRRRSVAVVEVPPFNSISGDDKEFYRRSFKVLVNDKGQYEYPPNWPTSNDYPGSPFISDELPELGVGLVTSVPIEIGVVNDNGFVSVRSFAQPGNFAPYTKWARADYVRTIELTVSLPSGASPKVLSACQRKLQELGYSG